MKRARPNVKEAKEALSAEQRDYHYYHSTLVPVSESSPLFHSCMEKLSGKVVMTSTIFRLSSSLN